MQVSLQSGADVKRHKGGYKEPHGCSKQRTPNQDCVQGVSKKKNFQSQFLHLALHEPSLSTSPHIPFLLAFACSLPVLYLSFTYYPLILHPLFIYSFFVPYLLFTSPFHQELQTL